MRLYSIVLVLIFLEKISRAEIAKCEKINYLVGVNKSKSCSFQQHLQQKNSLKKTPSKAVCENPVTSDKKQADYSVEKLVFEKFSKHSSSSTSFLHILQEIVGSGLFELVDILKRTLLKYICGVYKLSFCRLPAFKRKHNPESATSSILHGLTRTRADNFVGLKTERSVVPNVPRDSYLRKSPSQYDCIMDKIVLELAEEDPIYAVIGEGHILKKSEKSKLSAGNSRFLFKALCFLGNKTKQSSPWSFGYIEENNKKNVVNVSQFFSLKTLSRIYFKSEFRPLGGECMNAPVLSNNNFQKYIEQCKEKVTQVLCDAKCKLKSIFLPFAT